MVSSILIAIVAGIACSGDGTIPHEKDKPREVRTNWGSEPRSFAVESGLHCAITIHRVATPLLHVIAEELFIKFARSERDSFALHTNVPG